MKERGVNSHGYVMPVLMPCMGGASESLSAPAMPAPATNLNVQLNERSHDKGSQGNQGPFVVPEGRAAMLPWRRSEGSHLINGVWLLGSPQVGESSPPERHKDDGPLGTPLIALVR